MKMWECSRAAALCAGVIFCAGIGSAQTCQVSGISVGGSYIYWAVGNGTAPTTTTTTKPPAYSNTELGLLLGGLTTASPFAASGTLSLDGSGNVFANSSVQGGLATIVGSYVLNSDCTITMTLNDAFGTNATKTNLQGIVLNNGSEIDLGVLQTTTTSSGSTSPITTNTTQSNVLVKLVRPAFVTCATGDLSGPYALIGTGIGIPSSTSTTATGAPFFSFGMVQFDGNGNVISLAVTPSPLAFLQFTGTYTVNPDCTGTMTLKSTSSSGPTTTTGTGSSPTGSTTAMSLSFVLTQGLVPFNGGNPSGARAIGPEIEFTSSSSSLMATGYGIPQ